MSYLCAAGREICGTASVTGGDFECGVHGAVTEKQGIRLEYIQPGNPQQNAYVERYNRTVRYDRLGHSQPYHLIDSPRFGASYAPTVYETRGDSKL